MRHLIQIVEAIGDANGEHDIGRYFEGTLFHGSSEDFSEFLYTGSKIPALGTGYYFTPSMTKAQSYGNIIYTARIVCPKLLDWGHLTDADRHVIVADLSDCVPADVSAGHGRVVRKVFPPHAVDDVRRFFELKQRETKNSYHDRARANLSDDDEGNFVVSWMEASLDGCRNHDLLGLAQRYHQELARDLGYDGASFGDELAVFDSRRITILSKKSMA